MKRTFNDAVFSSSKTESSQVSMEWNIDLE